MLKSVSEFSYLTRKASVKKQILSELQRAVTFYRMFGQISFFAYFETFKCTF